MTRTVKRLPVDPGPAAWNEILPERHANPALESHQHIDVAIVGAGFAGLSAARRLQQLAPELSVTVLEASEIAKGPAGRNSGFMIDLPHDLASDDYAGAAERDHRQTTLNRAAIDFAKTAYEEALASNKMPTDAFQLSGKINAAASERGMAHNLAYAKHLASFNEPCELLDAAAMKTLTGIDYYQGGLYTPGTALLQPAAYIRGLADLITQSTNTRLYENSPVLSFSPQGTNWLLKTPNGTLQAAKVILAVNGHLQSFGYFTQHLLHVFTYAAMTEPLSETQARQLGGEPSWAMTPADPMGTTVRRLGPEAGGAGRIVVRNRFTLEPTMQASDARMRDVKKDLIQAFRARFPTLKDTELEWFWGGRLCLSRNDVQIIGELEPGIFAACCQNGLGTCKGTLAGIVAAEATAQAAGIAVDSLVPDYQTEPPPRKRPPEPLTSLVGNQYLRWKEWRAGREL